jgi:heme a synthase
LDRAALVLAQAALGGVRVLVGYPALSATAHAILAQMFFSTLVGLSLYLSPWWQREHAPLEDSGELPLRTLAFWTSAAIFVQLILGAGFRYGAFGVMPHMTGAGVVLILVTLTSRAVRKRFGAIRDLRRWGIFLQAFVGIQFLLGLADYWVIVSRRTPCSLRCCMYVFRFRTCW